MSTTAPARPAPSPGRASHHHRYYLIAVVAVALVAGMTMMLWPQPKPVAHLVWDPSNQFGIKIPAKPGPETFGSIPMCTDRPGEVQIVSLSPQHASGIAFLAVATRPATRLLYGAGNETLVQAGFSQHSAFVGVTCSQAKTTGPMEMGATFERTGPGPGKFSSVLVNYISGGKHLHLSVPWHLTLCPTKGTC